MLDTIVNWVNQLAGLWQHYTDLGCILVANVPAWAIVIIAETFFIPATWTARAQQGATILLNIVIAWTVAATLWWVFDPADPLRVRLTVTGILSPISPFAYVWVGKIATKYFPSVGSIFALPKPEAIPTLASTK